MTRAGAIGLDPRSLFTRELIEPMPSRGSAIPCVSQSSGSSASISTRPRGSTKSRDDDEAASGPDRAEDIAVHCGHGLGIATIKSKTRGRGHLEARARSKECLLDDLQAVCACAPTFTSTVPSGQIAAVAATNAVDADGAADTDGRVR